MSNKNSEYLDLTGYETKPKQQKEVTEARDYYRNYLRQRVNYMPGIAKVLLNIYNKNQNHVNMGFQPPIHDDLYNLLSDKDFILHSYQTLSKNRGATTPGPEGETADGMSLERIDSLHQKLKSGTYIMKPFRRVWFDKIGKKPDPITKKIPQRPLGIPDFEDRIVQEMIRSILEVIYEPWFQLQNTNFGFRSDKNCQQAITQITYNSQLMDYAIEGDIEKAFDMVIPETMIKILKKRIVDQKFLDLIEQGFACGLIENNEFKHTLLGTPQGGIASPILFNIYLHELDTFITTHIQETVDLLNNNRSNKKSDIKTQTYLDLDRRIKSIQGRLYARRNPNKKNAKLKAIYEKQTQGLSLTQEEIDYIKLRNSFTPAEENELTELKKRRASISQITIKTKKPIKISYTRYADDWILCLSGTKTLGKLIKNKISSFLKTELGLTLSQSKTRITNLLREYAKFLGFTITLKRPPSEAIYKKTINKTGQIIIRNKSRKQPFIGIDMQRVLSRMHLKRYCTTKGFPKESPSLSVLQPQQIVEHYNSVILGISNYYYSALTNKSHINRLIYILQYSCLKTLAQHFRRTIRHITKTRGFKDISTSNQTELLPRIVIEFEQNNENKYIVLLNYRETISRLRAILYNQTINPNPKSLDKDFFNYFRTNWRTTFKLSTCCIVLRSGSTSKIEMHHIRHVRKNKKTEGFARVMMSLNRRQIPTCKPCHQQIHKGTYNGISLGELYDSRVATSESYISAENPFLKTNTSKEVRFDKPYIIDFSRKTIISQYQRYWYNK